MEVRSNYPPRRRHFRVRRQCLEVEELGQYEVVIGGEADARWSDQWKLENKTNGFIGHNEKQMQNI